MPFSKSVIVFIIGESWRCLFHIFHRILFLAAEISPFCHQKCGLSALLNVITYFIRSKSTPLLFWQLLLPSSLQVSLPLPLACLFAPSPGGGVCLRALATSVHCFVPCLRSVQASMVGLFEAQPAGPLWAPWARPLQSLRVASRFLFCCVPGGFRPAWGEPSKLSETLHFIFHVWSRS